MITFQLSGEEPFTGIVCGFQLYQAITQDKNLPAELQGYEIIADYRMKNNVAFLVKNGELVTTYVGVFSND